MRFTVIDGQGSVSFVAECEDLFALVVACQGSPAGLAEMLRRAAEFRPKLADYVENGLAVFDEHHVVGQPGPILDAIETLPSVELPVFRVIDERTRQASLQPVKAGVVIFNLNDRRIVQVQNTYAEVRRKGRVALRETPVSRPKWVRYELPPDWAIVP